MMEISIPETQGTLHTFYLHNNVLLGLNNFVI